MADKKFYQLVKQDSEADLYIFGDITSCDWDDADKSANTIVSELRGLDVDNINVHINSYGGEVAEGLAIYNVLKNHKAHVTTICDGFACSAASVVFMAGDSRVMNAASLLMIHNAWTVASGDAEDLRKAADDVETVTQASVEAYKAVAKISEEEIKALMDADTWILPEKAVEYGFATEIINSEQSDEPQQSALGLIIQQLTREPGAVLDVSQDDTMIDSIADRIVEKISAALAFVRTDEEPDPDHHDPKPESRISGWDNFFQK